MTRLLRKEVEGPCCIFCRFAKEGANIVINYSSNESAAQETAKQIKAIGREAILTKADVSSKTDVDAMVSDALSRFNRIDVLVNNAGLVDRGSLQTIKETEWCRVMEVNLYGALNCSRAISESMVNRRYGKIINMSSVAGLGTSNVGSGLAYAASKSALIALTKRLAIELGPYGINVNAIAPGTVITDMMWVGRPKKETEDVIQRTISLTALGRLGDPQDVANAALFLASDKSNFITGQVLVVDGGRKNFFSHG